MATTILELAVTVYSGRHFPRLPVGHTVRIQATVDSQVRETIPSQIRTKSGSGKIATLGPQPVWQDGGRLAWHITKETLNKYKSTNPTIKLYVYSSGAAGTGAVSDTMSLGYIVIDLRSPNIYAAASDIKKKWLKLKGKGAHGDVLLSCKISAKEASVSNINNNISNPLESMVVAADASYVQIGNPNLPTNQLYNLEVTMISSKGLEALPLPYDDPNVPRNYWLTYCMFGVVTETGKFTNPKVPNFEPIVDSFRIRSDKKEFASFLQYDARPLEVCLRNEDSRLAIARIDISKLAKVMEGDNFFGVEMEGSYIFHSLLQGGKKRNNKDKRLKPLFAAKVAIRPVLEKGMEENEQADIEVEERQQVPQKAEKTEEEEKKIDVNTPSQVATRQVVQKNTQGESKDADKNDNDDDDGGDDDDYGDDDFEDENGNSENGGGEKTTNNDTTNNGDASGKKDATNTNSNDSDEKPGITPQPRQRRSEPSVPHRFRISIDLRSIKEVAERGKYCFLYTCNSIGCISTVRTRPPIMVDRNSEVLLPQGYSNFEVIMEPERLEQSLLDAPLAIELFAKGQYTKDKRTGVATVPFGPLINANQIFRDPKTRKTFPTLAMLQQHQRTSRTGNSGSKYITVKAHDQYFQVITEVEEANGTEGMVKRVAKVASVRVVLFLEDLGPSTAPPSNGKMMVSSSSSIREQPGNRSGSSSRNFSEDDRLSMQDSTLNFSQSMVNPARNQTINSQTSTFNRNSSFQSNNNSNVTAEMIANDSITQTALQKWFADEYAEWEDRMKKKEMTRMKQLEAEWSSRESERHQAIVDAQQRYELIENKLRQKLSSVEKRERELSIQEADLKRAAELQAAESKIFQRRLEEELQHKLNIEKQRSAHLEKRMKEAEKARTVAKRRVESIEEAYHKYKEDQRKTPESKLRQKINHLMVEKAEIEAKRVQQESESKLKDETLKQYKEQLSRLVKELQAERREKREASEKGLEQLRLQYLAREERYILDGDRQELRSIKDELDALKRANMFSPDRSKSGTNNANAPTPSRNSDRLIKEREILLGTGAYDEQHPIIVQIDKQISEFQNSSFHDYS